MAILENMSDNDYVVRHDVIFPAVFDMFRIGWRVFMRFFHR